MADRSSPRPAARPAFRTAAAEAAFAAAYDAVLARWPVAAEPIDVPSAYGTTHVQVCGPREGPPLVLLHGGNATSTVWFANVAALSQDHRVHAIDQIGAAGKSVHDGQPIRRPDDFAAWLDAVFDHLGLDRLSLCGHSYGAWLALSYALHAPGRLDRLILLDPTGCFAGLRLSYRLHALPLFARPSARNARAFLRWETAGLPLDPAWLALTALAAGEFRGSRLVLPRRPAAERLRQLTVPTLVVLAESSKAHDISRVADSARRLLPEPAVTVLPGASHHSVPAQPAAHLNRVLLDFLS